MTRKKQLAAKKSAKTTEASGCAKKKPEKQQENKKEEGCNCPNGCVVGQRIPAGARQPPLGAVRVQCRNDRCSAVPYVHGECYQKWAEVLANVLEKDKWSTRSKLSKDWIENNLWDERAYTVIFRFCKCPTCGSFLKREIHDEAAAEARRQQRRPQRPKVPEVPEPKEQNKTQTKPDMGKPTALAPKKLYQRTPGWSASLYARKDPLKNEENAVQRDLETASGARRKELKPKFVPVGAPGWREARGYEDEEETKNKEKDDHVTSFIVPSAMASGSFAADLYKTATGSVISGAQSTADSGADDGQSELNSQEFIRQIVSIARQFGGKIWLEDEQIHHLFSRASMELIVEITDMGGLDRWLPVNSTNLTVHRNTIVIIDQVNVPSHLKSLGQVQRLIEEKSGIVLCENFDCKVFFDENANITDGTKRLHLGDIISFTAELLPAPVYSCKWIITELCLLQRVDSIVPINTIPPQIRASEDLQDFSFDRSQPINLEEKQPFVQTQQNTVPSVPRNRNLSAGHNQPTTFEENQLSSFVRTQERVDNIAPMQPVNTIPPQIPAKDQNVPIDRGQPNNLEQKQAFVQTEQKSTKYKLDTEEGVSVFVGRPRNPPPHLMKRRTNTPPVRCSTPINNSFTSQSQSPVTVLQTASDPLFNQKQNVPMARVLPDAFAPIASPPVSQRRPSVLSQGSSSEQERPQSRDSAIASSRVETDDGIPFPGIAIDTSVLRATNAEVPIPNDAHELAQANAMPVLPKVTKPRPTAEQLRQKMAAHMQFNWKNDQDYSTKSDELEELFNSLNI